MLRLDSLRMPPLVLGVAMVLLAGCSSNEPREQPVPPPQGQGDYRLTANWSKHLADGHDNQHLFLQPAVVGDRVYAAAAKGYIGAYDARTGRETWWTRVDNRLIGGIGTDSEQLYVVTTDAVLKALSHDGDLNWEVQLPTESLVAPQSNGRQVVVQTVEGQLIAFSQNNGERQWQYDSNMPVLSFRGNAVPWVDGSQVVAGFDNGRVVSLDVADGSVEWQQALGSPSGRTQLERIVDVDASPVVRDGSVYIAGYQGKVAALSLRTGEEAWSRSVSSLRAPAVDNGRIVVAAADGQLVGYDLDSRREIWRHNKLEWRRLSAPIVLGDRVLVGDFEGYLYAVDQDDGSIAARTYVDDGGIRSAMVRYRDTVILLSNSGLVASYRIEEREPDSWFLSSP